MDSSDSEWLPRTGRGCTWGRSCRARSGSGEGFEKKSSLYVLELYPYTLQPHPESAPNAAPRAMVRIANLSLNGGSTVFDVTIMRTDPGRIKPCKKPRRTCTLCKGYTRGGAGGAGERCHTSGGVCSCRGGTRRDTSFIAEIASATDGRTGARPRGAVTRGRVRDVADCRARRGCRPQRLRLRSQNLLTANFFAKFLPMRTCQPR